MDCVVVSSFAFHTDGPGSIPCHGRHGILLLILFFAIAILV